MNISSSLRATRAYKTTGSQRRIYMPLLWGKILGVIKSFIIKKQLTKKQEKSITLIFSVDILCLYVIISYLM